MKNVLQFYLNQPGVQRYSIRSCWDQSPRCPLKSPLSVGSSSITPPNDGSSCKGGGRGEQSCAKIHFNGLFCAIFPKRCIVTLLSYKTLQ